MTTHLSQQPLILGDDPGLVINTAGATGQCEVPYDGVVMDQMPDMRQTDDHILGSLPSSQLQVRLGSCKIRRKYSLPCGLSSLLLAVSSVLLSESWTNSVDRAVAIEIAVA